MEVRGERESWKQWPADTEGSICIYTVYISMSARISSSVDGVTVVFSGREDNHQRMYESTEIAAVVELLISSVLSLVSTASRHRH